MFNPHTKFEMSTITCNEDMVSKAKCNISRFEPPFGGLALTAEALLREMCRNKKWRFLKGWVTISADFR